MFKAGYPDKRHIVQLLAQSFKDNLSVNYIIRAGDDQMDSIKALMDYSFELCFRYGMVYLSEDGSACALIIYPEYKKFGLFTIYQDVKLIVRAIGFRNLLKTLKRESQIKNIQPNKRMCYLWYIGVLPMWQGKGRGSKLLREVMDIAVEERRHIYLETSTLENLPWYRKRGFEIYHELDLGYTLYFLSNQ